MIPISVAVFLVTLYASANIRQVTAAGGVAGAVASAAGAVQDLAKPVSAVMGPVGQVLNVVNDVKIANDIIEDLQNKVPTCQLLKNVLHKHPDLIKSSNPVTGTCQGALIQKIPIIGDVCKVVDSSANEVLDYVVGYNNTHTGNGSDTSAASAALVKAGVLLDKIAGVVGMNASAGINNVAAAGGAVDQAGQTVDQTMEKLRQQAEKICAFVDQSREASRDKFDQLASKLGVANATDKIFEAKDNVENAVNAAKDNVAQGANQAAQAAGQAAQQAGQAVGQAAQDAGQAAQQAGQAVGQAAQNAGQAVSEGVSNAAEEAKKKAEELKNKLHLGK
jgi:hypothetical protein